MRPVTKTEDVFLQGFKTLLLSEKLHVKQFRFVNIFLLINFYSSKCQT